MHQILFIEGLIFFNPSPDWAYFRDLAYIRDNTVICAFEMKKKV
jgi:hypothetical protein